MKLNKKQIIIGSIIFLVIITLSIVYISNTKNKEVSTKTSTKNITLKYQENYMNIASYLREKGDISKEELEKLEPNKKLVESDGYYYIGSLYNDDKYKDLRTIGVGENNEGVSLTYLYEDDKPKEALSVQYHNENKNGYLNGIKSIYNKDSDESQSFITRIGTISAEDQEKLVNYIYPELKDKEEYKTYFKFAKIVQRSVSFPKEEFEKIDKNLVSEISDNDISVKINDCQLVFIHEDNMNVIRGLKLIDKVGNLLYVKSFVGDSPEVSGKGENYTMTEIINNSLEAQNDLLNKISENVVKSTPRTDGDNIINDNITHPIQVFSAEEDYDDMEFMDKISYSREENSKELSMKKSIEYVKSKLGEDIQEVGSKYFNEIGVTVVTYKLNDKIYKVRYQHTYKVNKDGSTLNEYDKNKSSGICIYKK